MFNEARVQTQIRNMLMDVIVPPIDLVEIRRRTVVMGQQPGIHRPYARFAAAAAATIAAGLFLTARSPALMQSLEERYRALTASGIGSGVPAPLPDAMFKTIHQSEISLSEAQQRANFAVVAPVGLPNNILHRKIFAAPLAVWLKRTNAWAFDGVQLTFVYMRKDGRTFSLIADRYSSLNGPPPRYLYDSDTFAGVSRNGRPIIKRYENFVWRNGDQELRVVADPTISAREIESVRVAMHGELLPRATARGARPSYERVVFYSMPEISQPVPR